MTVLPTGVIRTSVKSTMSAERFRAANNALNAYREHRVQQEPDFDTEDRPYQMMDSIADQIRMTRDVLGEPDCTRILAALNLALGKADAKESELKAETPEQEPEIPETMRNDVHVIISTSAEAPKDRSSMKFAGLGGVTMIRHGEGGREDLIQAAALIAQSFNVETAVLHLRGDVVADFTPETGDQFLAEQPELAHAD